MCERKSEGGRRCETALSRPGYTEMRRAYAATPSQEKVRQAFQEKVVRYAATGAGRKQVMADAQALLSSDPVQAAWLGQCARAGEARAASVKAAGAVHECDGHDSAAGPRAVGSEVPGTSGSHTSDSSAELVGVGTSQVTCESCDEPLSRVGTTGLCWECFEIEFSREAMLMGVPAPQVSGWVSEQYDLDVMDDEEIDLMFHERQELDELALFREPGGGAQYGSGTRYGYDDFESWDDYRAAERNLGYSMGVRWDDYEASQSALAGAGRSSSSRGSGYGPGGWGFGGGARSTVPYVSPHEKAKKEALETGKVVRRSHGPAGSGDGYVYIPQADGTVTRVWGLYGASGVLIRNVDEHGTERFFLAQRGGSVEGGNGQWAVPGGALDEGETPEQGALREFREEIRTDHEDLQVHSQYRDQVHEEWAYTTVIATSPTQFSPPEKLDWETKATGWFTRDQIASMELHPGFASAWPHLLGQLDNGQ